MRTSPPSPRLLPARAARLFLSLVASVALAACAGAEDEDAGPFERRDACAVSHILVSPKTGKTLGEAKARIRQIQTRLAAGESFADVARAMSDDASSAGEGGFLGFVPAWHETRFSGAIQVIEPGETRGPLSSGIGLQMIHRHPYEEGRALERRHRVAVHGFFVSSREAPRPSDRSLEEARRIAEEAYAKVRSGEMSLGAAAAAFGDEAPKREDAFLEVIGRAPATRWMYDAVSDVKEGSLAPSVAAMPGAFAVLARGRLLRAIVRHVLIAHVGSQGRDPSDVKTRSREEALRLAQRALQEARPDGSNWGTIVTKYSEDPATVSIEGSLGLVANGMLQASLEQAVLDTPPGRVASVVAETPAGFHLVYRVD